MAPRGTMSDEVRSDNPHSRLMALKRMGVVDDYERIASMTVLLVGIGGVGSVAAEMLTRCGVGKLVLFDYDTVELANMNRLFFLPSQCGMTKVAATKETLHKIDGDINIECHDCDICQHSEILSDRIRSGGDGGNNVDLLLCCVDNYAARTAISVTCSLLGQIWMESGVSENAVSGHIQTIIPGRTACFMCAPPLALASADHAEANIIRQGVCAASLPTTMAVVAGLLVQNALKLLLGFGEVSWHLGYHSMQDFFPQCPIMPNPECPDAWCCRRQQEANKQGHKGLPRRPRKEEPKADHGGNECGIVLLGEGTNQETRETPSPAAPLQLPRATAPNLRRHLSNLEKSTASHQ